MPPQSDLPNISYSLKHNLQKFDKTYNRNSEIGKFLFYELLEKISENINYDLPFKINVPKKIKNNVSFEKNEIDNIIKNKELLDSIYTELITTDYRKKIGQFLTPYPVAELMAKSGINNNLDILDPAVGTGIFLEKLYELSGKDQNIKFVGIDIDPLMLNVTALKLKLLDFPEKNITLINNDFFKMESLKKFDLIICNPPYLKFHNFDRNSYVNELEKELNFKVSRLINIYSLFMIKSLLLLRESGKLVFITPSEYLYTNYGKIIKKLLIQNTTIDALLLTDFSKLLFNDALTTSIISIIQKKEPEAKHKVKFFKIEKWSSEIQKNLLAEKSSDKNHLLKEEVQIKLNPNDNWLKFFYKEYDYKFLDKLVPFSKIAEIHRGIATGDNEYFTLSKNEIENWKIPYEFLKPVISKAYQCQNYDFNNNDHSLLTEKGEKVFLFYYTEGDLASLEKYIKFGEERKTNKRYLPRHRNPWFSTEKVKKAPILATVFSRDNMRFISNESDCLHLTSFHGIYPFFDDKDMYKALLLFLNSYICKDIQKMMRREYGGGLHKFEPKDLEKLYVPDILTLTKTQIKKLSKLFDNLCLTRRTGIDSINTERSIELELKNIFCIS